MSGPKRNPDKLNTIGVVVVGICGAVLVYVTIVALQAFYVDDTSEIQMMADYGGQDKTARDARATQTLSLSAPPAQNPRQAGLQQTYRVPLQSAINHVLEDATRGKPCSLENTCEGATEECRLIPHSDPNDPKNHVCVDLAHLVPAHGRADRPTIQPVPGRPVPLSAAPPADPMPTEDGAAPTDTAPAPTPEPARTP